MTVALTLAVDPLHVLGDVLVAGAVHLHSELLGDEHGSQIIGSQVLSSVGHSNHVVHADGADLNPGLALELVAHVVALLGIRTELHDRNDLLRQKRFVDADRAVLGLGEGDLVAHTHADVLIAVEDQTLAHSDHDVAGRAHSGGVLLNGEHLDGHGSGVEKQVRARAVAHGERLVELVRAVHEGNIEVESVLLHIVEDRNLVGQGGLAGEAHRHLERGQVARAVAIHGEADEITLLHVAGHEPALHSALDGHTLRAVDAVLLHRPPGVHALHRAGEHHHVLVAHHLLITELHAQSELAARQEAHVGLALSVDGNPVIGVLGIGEVHQRGEILSIAVVTAGKGELVGHARHSVDVVSVETKLAVDVGDEGVGLVHVAHGVHAGHAEGELVASSGLLTELVAEGDGVLVTLEEFHSGVLREGYLHDILTSQIVGVDGQSVSGTARILVAHPVGLVILLDAVTGECHGHHGAGGQDVLVVVLGLHTVAHGVVQVVHAHGHLTIELERLLAELVAEVELLVRLLGRVHGEAEGRATVRTHTHRVAAAVGVLEGLRQAASAGGDLGVLVHVLLNGVVQHIRLHSHGGHQGNDVTLAVVTLHPAGDIGRLGGNANTGELHSLGLVHDGQVVGAVAGHSRHGLQLLDGQLVVVVSAVRLLAVLEAQLQALGGGQLAEQEGGAEVLRESHLLVVHIGGLAVARLTPVGLVSLLHAKAVEVEGLGDIHNHDVRRTGADMHAGHSGNRDEHGHLHEVVHILELVAHLQTAGGNVVHLNRHLAVIRHIEGLTAVGTVTLVVTLVDILGASGLVRIARSDQTNLVSRSNVVAVDGQGLLDTVDEDGGVAVRVSETAELVEGGDQVGIGNGLGVVPVVAQAELTSSRLLHEELRVGAALAGADDDSTVVVQTLLLAIDGQEILSTHARTMQAGERNAVERARVVQMAEGVDVEHGAVQTAHDGVLIGDAENVQGVDLDAAVGHGLLVAEAVTQVVIAVLREGEVGDTHTIHQTNISAHDHTGVSLQNHLHRVAEGITRTPTSVELEAGHGLSGKALRGGHTIHVNYGHGERLGIVVVVLRIAGIVIAVAELEEFVISLVELNLHMQGVAVHHVLVVHRTNLVSVTAVAVLRHEEHVIEGGEGVTLDQELLILLGHNQVIGLGRHHSNHVNNVHHIQVDVVVVDEEVVSNEAVAESPASGKDVIVIEVQIHNSVLHDGGVLTTVDLGQLGGIRAVGGVAHQNADLVSTVDGAGSAVNYDGLRLSSNEVLRTYVLYADQIKLKVGVELPRSRFELVTERSTDVGVLRVFGIVEGDIDTQTVICIESHLGISAVTDRHVLDSVASELEGLADVGSRAGLHGRGEEESGDVSRGGSDRDHVIVDGGDGGDDEGVGLASSGEGVLASELEVREHALVALTSNLENAADAVVGELMTNTARDRRASMALLALGGDDLQLRLRTGGLHHGDGEGRRGVSTFDIHDRLVDGRKLLQLDGNLHALILEVDRHGLDASAAQDERTLVGTLAEGELDPLLVLDGTESSTRGVPTVAVAGSIRASKLHTVARFAVKALESHVGEGVGGDGADIQIGDLGNTELLDAFHLLQRGGGHRVGEVVAEILHSAAGEGVDGRITTSAHIPLTDSGTGLARINPLGLVQVVLAVAGLGSDEVHLDHAGEDSASPVLGDLQAPVTSSGIVGQVAVVIVAGLGVVLLKISDLEDGLPGGLRLGGIALEDAIVHVARHQTLQLEVTRQLHVEHGVHVHTEGVQGGDVLQIVDNPVVQSAGAATVLKGKHGVHGVGVVVHRHVRTV